MKSARFWPYLQATALRDFAYGAIVYLSFACAGCGHTPVLNQLPGPVPPYVSLGTIRCDRLMEIQEIRELLRTNGITMDLWGTRMYSILVPNGQESLAVAILTTNHLTVEEKLFLSTPTPVP
jgi:hypothetical protein